MGSEVCGEGAGVRRGGSGYTSLSQLSGMAAVHDGVFHGHVALGSKSVPRPSSSATEDAGERPRLRTTSGARCTMELFPSPAHGGLGQLLVARAPSRGTAAPLHLWPPWVSMEHPCLHSKRRLTQIFIYLVPAACSHVLSAAGNKMNTAGLFWKTQAGGANK